MKLTILGCGTSTGVPLIHCKCKVCKSRDPKDTRLRASVWVELNGKSILVDTSPDFRQQAIRAKIPRIDAVLYTHPHSDHLHGIDELRSFNFIQNERIPVYANQWTCDELGIRFPYIFAPGAVEGGGIPLLDLNLFDTASSFITAADQKIIPISLSHGSKESVGYRFDSVAYVTDCSYIPQISMERMQNLSVLVLDCLRLEPHRTHLNLDRALEIASQVKAKRTFLTHLGHDFEYKAWSKKLPKGVYLAYDGLKIQVKE